MYFSFNINFSVVLSSNPNSANIAFYFMPLENTKLVVLLLCASTIP